MQNDAIALEDQLRQEVESAQQGSAKGKDLLHSKKRKKYKRYTPEQRASIGKYPAENDPANAAAHFFSGICKAVYKPDYMAKHPIIVQQHIGVPSTVETLSNTRIPDSFV